MTFLFRDDEKVIASSSIERLGIFQGLNVLPLELQLILDVPSMSGGSTISLALLGAVSFCT